jgi:hypothetical protein
MVSPGWTTVLQKVLPEYERLSSAGEAHSALVKLGEVLAAAAVGERDEAGKAVRSRLAPALLERAAAEAARVRGRALHVLCIGTKFTSDEFILVLTMRIEVELSSGVLALFGIDTSAFDLGQLDEALKEAATSKENRRAFANALATIRGNWDVPIVDNWSS